MAELVDAVDSKSAGSNIVRVQIPPRPPGITYPNQNLHHNGHIRPFFHKSGVLGLDI